MQELLVALMVWVSAQTGMKMPEEPPAIKYVSNAALHNMMYPETENISLDYPRVRALYLNGIVFLPIGFKPTGMYEISVLVHELTHHVQMANGKLPEDAPCMGEFEKPAYEAQFAWIRAANQDPYKLIKMNALFYMMVTGCPFGVD